MQRRTFIHHFGLSAVALGAGIPQLHSSTGFELTILHTNDLHGRFVHAHGKFNAFGMKAGALIRKVRHNQANVLLLDAGDILHPSMAAGDELRWLESMGYDAFVLGNHEFDRGMSDLARQIKQNRISALAANYDLSNTPLDGLVKPYRIFEKGGQRIGVFGLGINPQGLVPAVLREGLVHQNPVEKANEIATHLKQLEGCSIVICLSHLGYHYADDQISDLKLVAQTRHIDLVIGGHTHTFLPEPMLVKNLDGKDVMINHAGWGGLLLGRIDLQYSNGNIQSIKGENTLVGAGEITKEPSEQAV
jgi:5'-nucleotidase